jgi:hypothetical protein
MEKDTQAYNGQVDKGISVSDVNVSVNPFGQNKAVDIAYRKAERLAIATHLVTNFVPDSECVRSNLRSRAQALLDSVMELRDGLRSAGPDKVSVIVAEVRKVLSMLDIIHASGYISNMNLDILKHAYVDLVTFLRQSEDGDVSESLELEQEYFMSARRASKGHISKGQINQSGVKDIERGRSVSDRPIGHTMPRKRRAQSVKAKNLATKRRMAVLDVVAQRGPLYIKDIASSVPNCSAKTVQRELTALVNDGILTKEGLKRWTKYSLVV